MHLEGGLSFELLLKRTLSAESKFKAFHITEAIAQGLTNVDCKCYSGITLIPLNDWFYFQIQFGHQ